VSFSSPAIKASGVRSSRSAPVARSSAHKVCFGEVGGERKNKAVRPSGVTRTARGCPSEKLRVAARRRRSSPAFVRPGAGDATDCGGGAGAAHAIATNERPRARSDETRMAATVLEFRDIGLAPL
jgi:hypothetical protein